MTRGDCFCKPGDAVCTCPLLVEEKEPETQRSPVSETVFPKSEPALVGAPRTAREWRLLGFPIPFFVPDDKRFTSVVLDSNGVLWMQGDWP